MKGWERKVQDAFNTSLLQNIVIYLFINSDILKYCMHV